MNKSAAGSKRSFLLPRTRSLLSSHCFLAGITSHLHLSTPRTRLLVLLPSSHHRLRLSGRSSPPFGPRSRSHCLQLPTTDALARLHLQVQHLSPLLAVLPLLSLLLLLLLSPPPPPPPPTLPFLCSSGRDRYAVAVVDERHGSDGDANGHPAKSSSFPSTSASSPPPPAPDAADVFPLQRDPDRCQLLALPVPSIQSPVPHPSHRLSPAQSARRRHRTAALVGPVCGAEQRCGREDEHADTTASCSRTVLWMPSSHGNTYYPTYSVRAAEHALGGTDQHTCSLSCRRLDRLQVEPTCSSYCRWDSTYSISSRWDSTYSGVPPRVGDTMSNRQLPV